MIRHLYRRTLYRQSGTNARGQRRAPGFTLIELLVVMAITVILLGLIFGPLLQGFDLTNRARVQVLTQDTARTVMETGMRDISNGVFVFDNTGKPINLWVHGLDASNNPVILAMGLPYSMVDVVPPARANDQNPSLNADIDPTTGLAIEKERGNLALPVAPGRVIVRYFLGLRDNRSTNAQPRKVYTNYYADPTNTNLNDHNPVILYRATVSPYLPDGTVDQRFFNKDPMTGQPVLYDANFFYDTTESANGLPPIAGYTSVDNNAAYNARGYGQVWENWKTIARAIVPTDRADEVVVQRDSNNKIVYFNFNNNQYPTLNALVRFQPTYVGNDAGAPTSESDTANEAPNIAPSTYTGTYGHWTIPFRTYIYTSALDANPVTLFLWQNNGNLNDQVMNDSFPPGGPLAQNPGYFWPNYQPQSLGVNAPQPVLLDPQTGDQIDPRTGSALAGATQPPQTMFTVDPKRGVIDYTFPDAVMLHDTQANGYVPTPSTWPNDPNLLPAVQHVIDINAAYNAVVANHPVDIGNALRYISLIAPSSNGGVSPLNTIPNAQLVPGSEVVRGPDMRPGPTYGQLVVYTRVPGWRSVDSLGPNEYIINYNDLPNKIPVVPSGDPVYDNMLNARQSAGTIIFDSHKHDPFSGSFHALPTTLDPGNSPGAPPAAALTVTYQFQTNTSGYTVREDYLTRQLMTFSLGVRLYEFNSHQPQQFNMTQKVKVRNLQR